MRLAIDYDGTIADTNRVKSDWILRTLGQVVAPWDCNRTDCVPLIGVPAYQMMAKLVYERESTLKTEPVPGAVEAIRLLAEAGQVYIVTARPPRRMTFAREWFRRRGLAGVVREYHSSKGRSKEEVCRLIGADVLIDDDLRHLRDVKLPGLRRFLLQHGREGSLPASEFPTCRSWTELLALLNELPSGR